MRRWRYPRRRRSQFYQVPSAPVTPPAAPDRAPNRISRLRSKVLPKRRGRYFQVPLQAPRRTPDRIRYSRLRARFLRRGRYYQVPPAQVTPPAAPAFTPDRRARRRVGLRLRRGRYFPVVSTTAVPPVTPEIVAFRVTRRGTWVKRSRFARFFRFVFPEATVRDIEILEVAPPGSSWAVGSPAGASVGVGLEKGSRSLTEPYSAWEPPEVQREGVWSVTEPYGEYEVMSPTD